MTSTSTRRHWLAIVGAAGAAGALAGACRAGHEKESEEEGEVAPPEDLMREHGLLNRVLLIYEEAARRIGDGQDLPPEPVAAAADVIKTFIEDYHEKLEEDYLFPRFEKAQRLADLTAVLRAQHQAGRRLTAQITQLAKSSTVADPLLAMALRQFVRMYRPHEAREDTVLFPVLRRIVSKQEFAALGEDFEKKEHELFGEEGFEHMVDRVATIEKGLGIYELATFTPQL
jgi:hemerythrin-like domain-containing protein